jgi:hypothetical protein
VSITIESLNNRMKALKNDLEETMGKANAISGAIQDCEYWIEQLDLEKTKEDLVPPEE